MENQENTKYRFADNEETEDQSKKETEKSYINVQNLDGKPIITERIKSNNEKEIYTDSNIYLEGYEIEYKDNDGSWKKYNDYFEFDLEPDFLHLKKQMKEKLQGYGIGFTNEELIELTLEDFEEEFKEKIGFTKHLTTEVSFNKDISDPDVEEEILEIFLRDREEEMIETLNQMVKEKYQDYLNSTEKLKEKLQEKEIQKLIDQINTDIPDTNRLDTVNGSRKKLKQIQQYQAFLKILEEIKEKGYIELDFDPKRPLRLPIYDDFEENENLELDVSNRIKITIKDLPKLKEIINNIYKQDIEYKMFETDNNNQINKVYLGEVVKSEVLRNLESKYILVKTNLVLKDGLPRNFILENTEDNPAFVGLNGESTTKPIPDSNGKIVFKDAIKKGKGNQISSVLMKYMPIDGISYFETKEEMENYIKKEIELKVKRKEEKEKLKEENKIQITIEKTNGEIELITIDLIEVFGFIPETKEIENYSRILKEENLTIDLQEDTERLKTIIKQMCGDKRLSKEEMKKAINNFSNQITKKESKTQTQQKTKTQQNKPTFNPTMGI